MKSEWPPGRRLPILRARLLAWYRTHRRRLPWREVRDPYAIWVSEVMLQQTQVATALPYYQRFLQRFPTVVDLARADIQAVLKGWEGLGYYARARNLHRAARMVVERHEARVPSETAEFAQLPGVGPYIAAAVLSIAFGHPLAVVDGNVKRVLARLAAMDEPVNTSRAHALFRRAADHLLDRRHPGDFNQALMELGALVCTPRTPDCPACPLAADCAALTAGQVMRFPQRLARSKPPLVRMVTGVVAKGKELLIVQRPAEGLLGGMWEFPSAVLNGGRPDGLVCAQAVRAAVSIEVTVGDRLACVRHTYSHFRLELTAFACIHRAGRVRRRGPAAHRWITPGALRRHPFHRVVHKFLPRVLAMHGG